MEVKVIYNACYGGFGLSQSGVELYEKLAGIKFDRFVVDRRDPCLIKVVETLGKDANSRHSDLKIQLIPEDFKECYKIEEYDGKENIDLSSILLVEYKLKNINLCGMSGKECYKILAELKYILDHDYYQ